MYSFCILYLNYTYDEDDNNTENLDFESNNNNNDNNNNDNNNNNKYNAKLWNELTNNNNAHEPISYGPAGAKNTTCLSRKKGNLNGMVPNYPVLATQNEVQDLQESLKKDLAGFLDEHSLDDYLLSAANNTNNNNALNQSLNMPVGGPVVGRPTKEPYKESPVGVEEITYDGKYKSYENLMYGSDIEKYT